MLMGMSWNGADFISIWYLWWHQGISINSALHDFISIELFRWCCVWAILIGINSFWWLNVRFRFFFSFCSRCYEIELILVGVANNGQFYNCFIIGQIKMFEFSWRQVTQRQFGVDWAKKMNTDADSFNGSKINSYQKHNEIEITSNNLKLTWIKLSIT